jgi:DNA-binding NtrC family response regulator
MSNTDSAIREAVESFVEELKGLIQRAALESVQAVLDGGGQSLRRGAKPARAASSAVAPKGRRKGAKRLPEELEELVGKLHAHIVKNPGQRMETIGASLGLRTKELVLPAKKLLSEKKLTTKGQKRATTYFAK